MSEDKPKTKDDRARRVVSYFIKSRNHRNKTWDKVADKAMKYYYGDQWGEEDKRILESQMRAPAVFNEIMPAIDLIIGHHIQGRVDLVAKPVDRFTDPELASIISSCIKNVEEMNDAHFERRNQFVDGVLTGFGIRDIYPDTEDDPEGVIRCKQASPWHYYLDPDFERYDYADGKRLFKETWLSLDEIKDTYGDKVAGQLPSETELYDAELTVEYVQSTWDSNSNDYGNLDDSNNSDADSWLLRRGIDRKNKLFRVIEMYEREVKNVKAYYDIESKELINLDDMSDEDRELVKDLAIKRKEKKIYLTTVVGDAIIAQDKTYTQAAEFYQLFNMYFPYFLNGKYWGVVENLFHPQDEVNKRHSTMIHILSTHDNSGIYYEEGAFPTEVEQELDHTLSVTGMAHKLNENGLSKIRDKQVKDIPPTYRWLFESQGEMIKHIAGAPDAFQGIAQRQESGRAKEMQINRAAVRLTPILDNFHKTMKMEGKAYIHWIQTFYTEERVIRVSGDEFGRQPQEVTINHPAFGVIFNDTSIGDYDITLEFEGKTQSERDRIKWLLVELSQTVPQFADIIAMHVLNYSDIPQKDAILEEFRNRQQMMIQQQQMGMQQGAIGGGRGAIQSAPRPSRGPRRMPTQMQATG